MFVTAYHRAYSCPEEQIVRGLVVGKLTDMELSFVKLKPKPSQQNEQ